MKSNAILSLPMTFLIYKECFQASAIVAFRKRRVKVSPGMMVGYVVRGASKWDIDTEWDAFRFDLDYYVKLIGKAWVESTFVFEM